MDYKNRKYWGILSTSDPLYIFIKYCIVISKGCFKRRTETAMVYKVILTERVVTEMQRKIKYDFLPFFKFFKNYTP